MKISFLSEDGEFFVHLWMRIYLCVSGWRLVCFSVFGKLFFVWACKFVCVSVV